jgi:hypothetical protein
MGRGEFEVSQKSFHRLKAAKMIRDKAKRLGDLQVARLSLERIAEALDEIVPRLERRINMRTYVISKEERGDIDLITLTQTLKAAGFKFDSEVCPIKFTRPFEQKELQDGSVVLMQWDLQ